MSETNRFIELSAINVNDKTEQKNKLTYLSWPFAWSEVKKRCPDATYNIKRFEHNLPYVFDEKVGYMVFTDVTIDGLTHEMWLPVMDGANKAMKDVPYQYLVSQWQNGKKVMVTKDCAAADMFDINKTIMRCLVKNLAMFGLGLYIYAGEDLPEDEEQKPVAPTGKRTITAEVLARGQQIDAMIKKYNMTREDYAVIVSATKAKSPADMTADEFSEHLKLVQQRFEAAK